MTDEGKIAPQLGIGGDWVMSIGIKSVVNRHAGSSSKPQIVADNRRPSTVGKNGVVLRNESAERVRVVRFDSRQGGRRIHVPENDLASRRPAGQDPSFQSLVIGADSTVLDHDLRLRGIADQFWNAVWRFIETNIRIVDVSGVPMILASVNGGFSEGDAVSEAVQVLINAAIVGGCAVPVRGRQAGAEDKNVHLPNSLQISSNCNARCRQVCRCWIFCSAEADSCFRAASSRSRCRISAFIASPSGTQMKSS